MFPDPHRPDPARRSGPVESPFTHLDRIEAAAELLVPPTACRHCVLRPQVDVWAGEVPRAVGWSHEPGCPGS